MPVEAQKQGLFKEPFMLFNTTALAQCDQMSILFVHLRPGKLAQKQKKYQSRLKI